MTKDEAVEHERLAAAQAQRENQAAEKRQSLREVRAAMLAKLAGEFAGDDGSDDDELFADDISDAARRVIPHGFLWSIVPPAIRSREMANCEAQVEAANIPVLGRVYQRTAFSSLFSFMTTLDELPPSEVSGIDKAKGDAIRLAEAIGKLVNPTGTTTVEVAA